MKALLVNPSGVIRFTLNLLKAQFLNGVSFGLGITTSATKVSWEDRPVADALDTWKHELGHRVGMVTFGDRGYDPVKRSESLQILKVFFQMLHLNFTVTIIPLTPSRIRGHIAQVEL